MPITQEQIVQAEIDQHHAARDENSKIRLIAGPGTGKSHTIQERVRWLLDDKNVSPEEIFVVSFTRASALDLRMGIRKYCLEKGCQVSDRVRVSTLHSLALWILRRANRLAYYPGTPMILDEWELEEVYDKEFSDYSSQMICNNRYSPTRSEEIRKYYEAYCETEQYNPPGYFPPDPPVSAEELQDFIRFHDQRNQLYSCVLPGELVRNCFEQMETGLLNIPDILGISHLIVDEYQDLNPVDIHFIDYLINQGVITFVAGDDDQSIYSFRYAFPQGIQSFTTNDRFPDASSHEIIHCFRCTPIVLHSAQRLLDRFSEPNRLPKETTSLFSQSNPIVPGNMFLWHFQRDFDEANAIAQSCRQLILAGINPEKILILLSNTKVQQRCLTSALDNSGLLYELPKEPQFINSEIGRFIYAIIRIAYNDEDYFAHRLLLGLYPGIGIRTCNNIARIVLENNLNYKDLFYNQIPEGIFTSQQVRCIDHIKSICHVIRNWNKQSTYLQIEQDILRIIFGVWGENGSARWSEFLSFLPLECTLEELYELLGSKNTVQKTNLLSLIYERLNLPKPEGGFFPRKIKLMTIHGVKGLNGEVVFIPGLEENILPGDHRLRFPGLILEAARMLYVAITRARVACVVSYADQRFIFGASVEHNPSRFNPHLNGVFQARETGLDANEVRSIIGSINNAS